MTCENAQNLRRGDVVWLIDGPKVPSKWSCADYAPQRLVGITIAGDTKTLRVVHCSKLFVSYDDAVRVAIAARDALLESLERDMHVLTGIKYY